MPPKYGVAWFVMKELNKSFHLLDSFENCSLISCVHPISTHQEVFWCRPYLRLLISHWLASSARSSDYPSLNTIVLSFTDSPFNHFFPLADLNTACFPSQGPLYCPRLLNFSRSVEKYWCHLCQGFYKLDRCSFCLTIFLVRESTLNISKIMSI